MSPPTTTGERSGAPAPSPATGWSLPDVTRERLWPTGLLFSVLALLATFTNDLMAY